MLFTDKTPYLGGTQLSSAYVGGQKVWPGRDPAFAGWEAMFDMFHDGVDGAVIGVNRMSGSKKITVSTPQSVHAHISAVFSGTRGHVVLTQNGREAIYVGVAGSTITLRTTGDRGKYPIEFTAPYPTGIGTSQFHLVQVSTYQDWYGYRVKLLIDGDQVETATNGGAFNLSEKLTPGSTAELLVSGSVTAFGWKSRALVTNEQTSSALTKDRMKPGFVCWATYQSDGPVNSAIPAAEAQAWLVSGGQGGQGGSRYSSGGSGAYGVSVKLPWWAEGHTLSVGAGGSGGAPVNTPGSGQGGKVGAVSTYGEYSTAGSTVRETEFSAWGSSIKNPLGYGGSGGSAEKTSWDSDDNRVTTPATAGTSGGSGGLVVARRWVSTGMVGTINNNTSTNVRTGEANGLPGKWDATTTEGDASLFVVAAVPTFLEVMADVTCDRDVRSRAGTIISKGTVLTRGTLVAAVESAMGTQRFVFTGV